MYTYICKYVTRLRCLLAQDEPSKKGFKVAHVPPAPVNMQLAAPWVDPGPGGAAAVGRGKDDRDKFTAPGEDGAVNKVLVKRMWQR